MSELIELVFKRRARWANDDPYLEVNLTAAQAFQSQVGCTVMQNKVASIFPNIDETGVDVDAVYDAVKNLTCQSWYAYVDIDGKGVINACLDLLQALSLNQCPEDATLFHTQDFYKGLRDRIARAATFVDDDTGVTLYGLESVKASLEYHRNKFYIAIDPVALKELDLINTWKFLLDDEGAKQVAELTDLFPSVGPRP